MRTVTLLYIIITALICTGCGKKYGIERRDSPTESLTISISKEGKATIRSLYCDISLRQVKDHHWEEILENPAFKGTRKKYRSYRVPKLLFFLVSVKNTWSNPVTLEKGVLIYRGGKSKNLSAGEILARYRSLLYRVFNFDEILRTRRLLGKIKKIDSFDFRHKSIPYRLSFIPPGDTAAVIMAFEKPPARVRNYSLNFHLAFLKKKKVIAFRIRRFEYRTRGRHFIEKKARKEENP